MPLKSRYLRIEAAGGDDGYAYGNLSGAVTKGRFSLFAAGSYRRSDGYIHNTDFENYNGYLRMNYDSEKAGFFDFQAGYRKLSLVRTVSMPRTIPISSSILQRCSLRCDG